jgi:hypothetical protein
MVQDVRLGSMKLILCAFASVSPAFTSQYHNACVALAEQRRYSGQLCFR